MLRLCLSLFFVFDRYFSRTFQDSAAQSLMDTRRSVTMWEWHQIIQNDPFYSPQLPSDIVFSFLGSEKKCVCWVFLYKSAEVWNLLFMRSTDRRRIIKSQVFQTGASTVLRAVSGRLISAKWKNVCGVFSTASLNQTYIESQHLHLHGCEVLHPMFPKNRAKKTRLIDESMSHRSLRPACWLHFVNPCLLNNEP